MLNNDDFILNDAFGVQGDPSIEEKGSVTEFPDGDCEVNGIFGFFGKGVNADGVPFFVPDSQQHMVARFHLRLADGDAQGPPCTATRAQIAALVSAFGGDEKLLPREDSPKFLFKAQELANASRRVRKTRVYKNWTRPEWVDGAIPDGNTLYVWRYVGARSVSGEEPVRFEEKTTKYPSGEVTESIAFLKFAIVSDVFGNATPFDGYEMEVKFYNPFDGTVAPGDRPGTRIGKSGGIPIEVNRLNSFCRWFAPNIRGYRWQTDSGKSEQGINELDNPLAVLDRLAKAAGTVAVAKIEFTKPKNANNTPRAKLDLNSFSAAGTQTVDRDVQAKEEQAQPTVLLQLVELIEKLAGIPIFVETEKGANQIDTRIRGDVAAKDWAVKNLRPACEKLSLTKTGNSYVLSSMSEPELLKLYNFLNVPFDAEDVSAEEQGF